MNIINNELFEALQSRYMSRWYEEIEHNGNVFIFNCIGESQWNVFKNNTLIDTYSFHYFEEKQLNEKLNFIFS